MMKTDMITHGLRTDAAVFGKMPPHATVNMNPEFMREMSELWVAAANEIERLRAEHDALRAERDEVRQSYCSLMEAYRGGDGRVTANKLGWGYLFEEDKP